MNDTAPQSTWVHPFEKSGLGKAPFRYIGLVERVCGGPDANGFQIGVAGQPAGTCDHCGTGIKYCCQIVSADGKRFEVGCDCVMKTDRVEADLVRKVKTAKAELDSAKRKAAAAARRPGELARIEEAQKIVAASPERWADQPHPCITGKTLTDYFAWILRNGGHAKRLSIAKTVLADG